MPRTTEEELRQVIDVGTDIPVDLFIELAGTLTDKVAECAIEREHTLTDGQLRGIETYLAAHFYTGRDPQYKSKRTERSAASFFGKEDNWLEMAKLLDTSGCLDSFGEGKALMAWLGKPPSTQIDYVDRD